MRQVARKRIHLRHRAFVLFARGQLLPSRLIVGGLSLRSLFGSPEIPQDAFLTLEVALCPYFIVLLLRQLGGVELRLHHRALCTAKVLSEALRKVVYNRCVDFVLDPLPASGALALPFFRRWHLLLGLDVILLYLLSQQG